MRHVREDLRLHAIRPRRGMDLIWGDGVVIFRAEDQQGSFDLLRVREV